MHQRDAYHKVMSMLQEDQYLMIYLRGPRASGKTSFIKEVMRNLKCSHTYLPAKNHDESGRIPSSSSFIHRDRSEGKWLIEAWYKVREKIEQNPLNRKHVIFVDDVQCLIDFSSYIKPLWDQDRRFNYPIHVVLTGSTSLLIQENLTDSMVGRILPISLHHWSYGDMSKAFGVSLDDYLLYGGYPGGQVYLNSERIREWSDWVEQSIIQESLDQDILAHLRVDKPQLMRDFFRYSVRFSSQVVSLRKMMQGLDDVGNPQTLKRYLGYFEKSQLMVGLANYDLPLSKRSSSLPKYLALNTALITALQIKRHRSTLVSPDFRFQLLGSAVGAHLYNYKSDIFPTDLYYWRDSKKGYEVDYVLEDAGEGTLAAFQVLDSSTCQLTTHQRKALKSFEKRYGVAPITLGEGGDVTLEKFFLSPPATWLRQPSV